MQYRVRKGQTLTAEEIRATAKPIITSTPKITSARFTGRDYLKASADLHNRGEFCTGRRVVECASPNAKGKALSSPAPTILQTTGLLSGVNSLHNLARPLLPVYVSCYNTAVKTP